MSEELIVRFFSAFLACGGAYMITRLLGYVWKRIDDIIKEDKDE